VGLNDSEAAIRCLETVVKLQPANPESQIRLGMLLLQTGRASESLPHFEAVLKSDPFNDEAKTFLLKARDSLNRTSTPNATLHAP
jgi:cytochrome c-type biogenesis protein CcmH/NrfG